MTFVLKIVTLILVSSGIDFHMFFNCENAALALLIFAFKSASDPPGHMSFHLFQSFSIKCDNVGVLYVLFEDLAFSPVYVEPY